MRFKRSLRLTYWWALMSSEAEEWVKTCDACQRSAKSKPRVRIPDTDIPAPQEPGAQYALDITGPFFNGQLLVFLIDTFARYPLILDTKDTTSNTIISWMKEQFEDF
ncbi:MAG: hypothetical protein GY696_13910, partial [Gammaproteobacteria bacterium]|nr:hypothetical protein [Gammaproteobacteria bacterium]